MVATALYAAGSGIAVAQTTIDVIAHNIANIRTNGFKKFRVESADLPYICQRKEGIHESADTGVRPVGTYIGLGAQVVGSYRILGVGSFERTEQQLDLAIQGPGYFAVNLPNGKIGYTRNGSFQVNPNGDIVTREGYTLVDAVNVGEINTNTITISSDGVVTAPDPNNGSKLLTFQPIQIYNFVNDRGLEPISSNYLGETVGSGPVTAQVPGVDGSGTLIQGSVESSNVDPTTELTALIMAQRAYEHNSKVIRTVDENEKTISAIKQ